MSTRHGFTRSIIPFPEGEYMRRWIFSTPWFTVRLHKIQLADEYRPHNHPWNFISVVLRGKYDEELYSGPDTFTTVTRRPFVPVLRKRTCFHRVVPINKGRPVWTLVLTDGYRKDPNGDAAWGFWNDDGEVVPWRRAHDEFAIGQHTKEV